MLYWMCIHNGFRSHMAKIANYGQRTNVKHTLHLSNTPKLNFTAFKQLNKSRHQVQYYSHTSNVAVASEEAGVVVDWSEFHDPSTFATGGRDGPFAMARGGGTHGRRNDDWCAPASATSTQCFHCIIIVAAQCSKQRHSRLFGEAQTQRQILSADTESNFVVGSVVVSQDPTLGRTSDENLHPSGTVHMRLSTHMRSSGLVATTTEHSVL